MSQFKFIKAKNAYNTLYFQFPKVLMYGERYQHLSDSTKLAYMLLRDRMEISIRNNWIDEDGNIFFNFTVKSLAKLLNCGNQKVNVIKHELENAELLYQKQVGLKQANRLYLAELEVGPQDIYRFGDDTVQQPRTQDRIVAEPNAPTDADMPSSPETDIQSNLPEMKNEKPDSKQLENELLSHLSESLNNEYSTTVFDDSGLKLISMWCNTISQAKHLIGIVLKAKRDTENKYNTTFVVEYSDYQAELTKTLRRYLTALKDESKTIENPDAYLYIVFKHAFSEICEKEIFLSDHSPIQV